MSIPLKDFSYTISSGRNGSKALTLEIPLPRTAKADIHLTPLYLKINSPPYLFTLDFAYAVQVAGENEDGSSGPRCTVHPHKIIVCVELTDEWPGDLDDTGGELLRGEESSPIVYLLARNRKDLQERRNLGDKMLHDIHEANRQAVLDEKAERDRELVRRQIELEQEERAVREQEQLAEKREAEV